jgi:hypothetical protein
MTLVPVETDLGNPPHEPYETTNSGGGARASSWSARLRSA